MARIVKRILLAILLVLIVFATIIYRFAPLRIGAEDLPRIHGKDERIAISNYGEMIQFYIRLIRNADATVPAR